MFMKRIEKRNLRDVSFAATIALMMTLTGFMWLSPTASATTDVLRMLTTTEWEQDGPTGLFSVTSADLDGDGTVEVIVGGISYPYQVWPPPPILPGNWPRGYLAVFYYGGCRKTLNLLDQEVWNAAFPNEDTAVFSVVVGDFDRSITGLEIVTAGYTMVGPWYRGELRMWQWVGTTRTLQLQGFLTWPALPSEPNTYAYSAFAADIDGDGTTEVITAGSYGDQPDLRAWYWSAGFTPDGQGYDSGAFRPAAWKGVSVGDVDGTPASVEIVTSGYGTYGSDTVSLLQIWRKVGPNLQPQLSPAEYYWLAPGHVATANSTYVGSLASSSDARILTVGSSKNSGGAFEQEMKVFDWRGIIGFPLEEKISKLWVPPGFSQAWGTGTYASDVDMDGQIEMLAVGFFPGYADLSIWHWNGERPPPDPPYPIESETYTTWVSPYPFARADAVYVSNANGDLDDIPEIVTAGTVTYLIYPPPPANPVPSRKGQLRLWDWNLPKKTLWTDRTDPNPSNRPPSRAEQSMVYNSRDRRTIMFGGYRGGYFQDTWGYNAGTHSWTEYSTGSSPSPRKEGAVMYDTKWDRVILFGGENNYVLFRDTWEFVTHPIPQWQPVSVVGNPPSARYAPTFVYDERREVGILFGGYESPGVYLSDTWQFDYNTKQWTNRNPSVSPPGRTEHMMVYDCERDRIVLFGGYAGPDAFNDLWEYDYEMNIWAPQSIPGAPTPRVMSSMAYDSQGEVTVLFGGRDMNGQFLDDTWTYDGSSWIQETPSVHPNGRAESDMVYDLHANRNIIFSGWAVGLGDTWEYRYS